MRTVLDTASGPAGMPRRQPSAIEAPAAQQQSAWLRAMEQSQYAAWLDHDLLPASQGLGGGRQAFAPTAGRQGDGNPAAAHAATAAVATAACTPDAAAASEQRHPGGGTAATSAASSKNGTQNQASNGVPGAAQGSARGGRTASAPSDLPAAQAADGSAWPAGAQQVRSGAGLATAAAAGAGAMAGICGASGAGALGAAALAAGSAGADGVAGAAAPVAAPPEARLPALNALAQQLAPALGCDGAQVSVSAPSNTDDPAAASAAGGIGQDAAEGGAHAAGPGRSAGAADGEAGAPLRLHAEWAEQGVRIWIGADQAALLSAGSLALLGEQLRRFCREQGAPLLALVCNGKPVALDAADAGEAAHSTFRPAHFSGRAPVLAAIKSYSFYQEQT